MLSHLIESCQRGCKSSNLFVWECLRNSVLCPLWNMLWEIGIVSEKSVLQIKILKPKEVNPLAQVISNVRRKCRPRF